MCWHKINREPTTWSHLEIFITREPPSYSGFILVSISKKYWQYEGEKKVKIKGFSITKQVITSLLELVAGSDGKYLKQLDIFVQGNKQISSRTVTKREKKWISRHNQYPEVPVFHCYITNKPHTQWENTNSLGSRWGSVRFLVLSPICSLTMSGPRAISRKVISLISLGAQLGLSARTAMYAIDVWPGLPSTLPGSTSKHLREPGRSCIVFDDPDSEIT